MRESVRALLCLVCAVAIINACKDERDKPDTRSQETVVSLTALGESLAAGDPQPKAEPFAQRPFRPYLGEKWIGNAVAYGCYRAGQAPGQQGPSDAELLEDLGIIARHWNLIRVYGADDDTRRILQVIETHQLPVRVMLGIWLEGEDNNPDRQQANIEQVTQGIRLANRYREIVIAVTVGNETQVFWSGHRVKPAHLIRYIRAVRANVTVPVATADDYNFWNKPESKEVADEIDFIVTHMHPLWNGKTLETAIGWLDGVYHEIRALHPGRTIVLGETGWATDYDPEKIGDGQQGTLMKGDVSVAAQADFLIRLRPWIDSTGVTTFLFEAFDEPWKGGGAASRTNDVEKHWGVYDENRRAKESFLEYLARYGEGRK